MYDKEKLLMYDKEKFKLKVGNTILYPPELANNKKADNIRWCWQDGKQKEFS